MWLAGCQRDEFEEGVGEVGEDWEEVGMGFVAVCWDGDVLVFGDGVDEGLEGFCEIRGGGGGGGVRSLSGGGIVIALL